MKKYFYFGIIFRAKHLDSFVIRVFFDIAEEVSCPVVKKAGAADKAIFKALQADVPRLNGQNLCPVGFQGFCNGLVRRYHRVVADHQRRTARVALLDMDERNLPFAAKIQHRRVCGVNLAV